MVHCERCGAESVPVGGSFDYCVVCGLYVCQACWHAAGFCTACAPSTFRRTTRRDAVLLRRVDRRFREAGQEAGPLKRAAVSARHGDDLAAEVACLELKVASAARVRDQVLGRRISATRRARLEPLLLRLDRHATEAQVAATRAAGAATLVPTGRTARDHRHGLVARLRERKPSLRWASAAVAVLLVAVVSASLASRAARLPGEGTLSGVPDVTPERSAPLGVESPLGGGETPTPPAAATAFEAGFDDDRIGPISDVVWREPPADARVVAFPGPFDRSVEVRSPSGSPLEACLAPDPGIVQSVSADLRLDDGAASVATIGLRDGSTPGVQIGLGPERSIITLAGTPTGAADGLEAAVWHHIRVEVAVGVVDVRVAPIDGGQSVDMTVNVDESLPAHAVCFGISGAAGASVHYDNLAVAYQRSSDR